MMVDVRGVFFSAAMVELQFLRFTGLSCPFRAVKQL